ncbi:MAG TPA: hypothetical protein VFG22_05755 [Polyangiales bacterium]|nr:hypothetical protein [Polyangiales bacterium]
MKPIARMVYVPGREEVASRLGGEWSSLIEMAPASLDLMSPRGIATQGLQLISNAANPRRFDRLVADVQGRLRAASVPVLIEEHRNPAPLQEASSLTRPRRRWLGQLALELYFAQLFRGYDAALDLRPSRFGVDGSGDAVWRPRPIYVRWNQRFLKGIRDVYEGFFFDRAEQLDAGLAALGLGSSAGLLLGHLGDGNQRSVRFGSEQLRSLLREMADRRQPEEPKLHPNFIAFGLLLTGLHELLEELDLAFDVRSAFMRTHPGT